jgi:hypothetical protein
MRQAPAFMKQTRPRGVRHARALDDIRPRPAPLRKEQSARPRGLGTRAACALAQKTFWVYLTQFIPLEVNMVLRNLKLLICLLILGESTLAQAKCFNTVSELKANNVRTKWQETTHNDRKPLTISITDGANGLVYSAKKAGLLWLTGNVSVCRSGGVTEITLKNTQATSNVPMLARLALPSTQSAHIVNDQIKLAGGGWGGTFIGH